MLINTIPVARSGRQLAVYLRDLARVGALEEVRAGREKLFINPRLMRLLTLEQPGDLSFRTAP